MGGGGGGEDGWEERDKEGDQGVGGGYAFLIPYLRVMSVKKKQVTTFVKRKRSIRSSGLWLNCGETRVMISPPVFLAVRTVSGGRVHALGCAQT